MTTRKRTSFFAFVAALGALALSGQAQAVPCGAYSTYGGIKVGSTDLGTSSATCRNSPTGDANDSAADLNNGNYFGSNTWVQLDRSPDGGTDASLWSFNPVIVDGQTKSGQFTITSAAWSLYSQLVVVLKDGGSTLNKDIKWSAYLLPTGVTGPYDWSYDLRKGVSHITLYGIRGGTVTVPEPATLAIFALGLLGAGMVLRRQRAQARR